MLLIDDGRLSMYRKSQRKEKPLLAAGNHDAVISRTANRSSGGLVTLTQAPACRPKSEFSFDRRPISV